jgi:ATP-binding protein involved in chromosome partitioning
VEWDAGEVRRAIGSLADADGSLLVPERAVGDVLVAPGWVAVVLKDERLPLARVQAQLSRVFPGVEVEVRAGGRISRGGQGFGPRRHVVAVLGGKGGVGKSTVAVNLALTLSAMGHTVGLLDGDLNGPDIPHLLGVHPRKRPRGDWRLAAIRPPADRQQASRRLGLEVMSVGFVVNERAPIAATGHWLVSGLLRNLLFDVAWTADVVILDAPPGTGEEIQVMVRELPLSGGLFVTTPQDLAQMDAERTLAHLREHHVPVIGMVQNMAGLECPHCGHAIDLYATSARLQDAGVPIIGRIPFDTRLSVTADRGLPLVLGDPRGPIAYEFARIGSSVRRWLAERERALSDAA